MKSTKLVLFITALAISLTACDPKKDDKKSARGSRGGTQSGTAGVVSGGLSVQSLPKNYGYQMQEVDVTSSDVRAFEAAVAGLVSAELTSADIGVANKFVFWSFINFDNNGMIDRANSKLQIEISDDKGLIGLYFDQLHSGTVNGNNVTLNFQDNLGSVTIQGVINNNSFTGTVTYRNFTNATSGQAAAQGTIGQFSTSTCAVFNCF